MVDDGQLFYDEWQSRPEESPTFKVEY